MGISVWLTDNYVEVFGAVTGIIYVFLEIRQNLWLWPVGILTSAAYIWIFFSGKLYADMSLQAYYLVISILGWIWWIKGGRQKAEGERQTRELPSMEGQGLGLQTKERLQVSRLKFKTGIVLGVVFVLLYITMWLILDRLTDSPVPEVDSFITSLSIIATWMLARKIYEHWYLWLIVNTAASILFFTRHLYPTLILYIIYGIMSYAGLKSWKRTLVSK